MHKNPPPEECRTVQTANKFHKKKEESSEVSLKKCILVHHNYGVLNQNPECSGCIDHFL